MRRYKPYSTYKPSGVEWLGNIPKHWQLKRLKFVCYTNPSKSEIAHLPNDTEVSFCPMELLGNGTISTKSTKLLGQVRQGFTYFRDGDIVIAKITPSFENGKGAIASSLVNGLGFGTTELHVLRPGSLIDRHFLYYLTISGVFRGFGATQMYGTAGQKRISDGFLNNFPTPLPPFEEQKLIVAFLDCEIRRLDTLITNKRELIDLLQKKRNAIITDAVTKGLNLDVPLKDSGVSWIGKVPQHWEIRRFKFMLKYLEQGWSPACENRLADEEEWGVLKVGCVNGGYFNELEHKALPNNLEPKLEYEIKIGDVLISRANTKELLGSTAKVHSVQRNLLLCDKLYRIKTVSDVDPDFFVILLQSAPARYQFERESSGASDSMQNISQASMGNFILPLAPIREQKLITEKLHEDFMIIGILKEKLVKQIGELQKYRQALITAAVTGKIDVREEFAQGVA